MAVVKKWGGGGWGGSGYSLDWCPGGMEVAPAEDRGCQFTAGRLKSRKVEMESSPILC